MNNEDRTGSGRLAHNIGGMRKAIRRRNSLILLITMAVSATCGTSYAQSIKGSPGAGFQSWTTADLNNSGAPYWDNQTLGVLGPNNKNVGYCLTATGDCVGILSALFAPGSIPFWGMSYDPIADTGGNIDPNVFFENGLKQTLKATLELQLTNIYPGGPTEINEFGWFETNVTGTILGPRHVLFQGSGVPPGSKTPDPVGKTVSFQPTLYFGYYFSDVSENGCLVYTLSSFTDPVCSDHNFAVFSDKPSSPNRSFWIAGLDPSACPDADCNLTLVKVSH